MKTHAPESRGQNTPKSSVKQGQNPSELGHLAELLNLDPEQMKSIQHAAEHDKVSVMDFFKRNALQSVEALSDAVEFYAKQNPSEFGENGKLRHLYRNPEHLKALFYIVERLEESIDANYALTHLIQDSINIQFHEGSKDTQSKHWQKMNIGIHVLFNRTNFKLEDSVKDLRATIYGEYH